MNFIKKASYGIAVSLLLAGCVTNQPALPIEQRSAFIVMKTPVLRYADQGFIKKMPKRTKVEIYSNGAAVMKLEIAGGKVCSGNGLFSCMSQSVFNQKYLSPYYPADTLEKLFRGEKIFSGKNLVPIAGGFKQKITQKDHYDINYTVLKGSTVFHDTIANILIKIKDN